MQKTFKRITALVMALVVFAMTMPLAAQAQDINFNPLGDVQSARALAAHNTGEISEDNIDGFDLGFALVRTQYFVSEEAEDAEFTEAAGWELYFLSERLVDAPEFEQLDVVIGMYLDGTGTREERWDAVQEIIDSYSQRAEGERKWYFDAGITLTKISLFSYLEDEERLRIEQDNLIVLVEEMPESVPTDVADLMFEVADAEDVAGLGEVAEEAMGVVLG